MITPLPWKVVHPKLEYERENFDRTIAATMPSGNPASVCRVYNNIAGDIDNNADFIVMAVNCHADLVRALEFYADRENNKEIETGIGMLPSPVTLDGGSTARDVLAKAKGV